MYVKNEYERQRRVRRRAQGLCDRCTRKSRPGLRTCQHCANYGRAYRDHRCTSLENWASILRLSGVVTDLTEAFRYLRRRLEQALDKRRPRIIAPERELARMQFDIEARKAWAQVKSERSQDDIARAL